MPNVDLFMYVGDDQIAGGELGVFPSTDITFGIMTAFGLGLMVTEIQRVVPSGADGISGGGYSCYFDGAAVVSIAATGGSSTTISVASAQWGTNMWVGRTITVTAGTGVGSTGVVTANTSNQATVTSWSGAAPGAGSTFNFGAGGYIVPFHYLKNGPFLPQANGDNWFYFPAITSNSTLIQKLGRWYGASAPGFRMLKVGSTIGVGGYRTGQSDWTNVMAKKAFMDKWEQGQGNTLVPKAIIVDAMTTDIYNVNASFATHLTEMIDTIRADLGNDVLIIVVKQSEQLYSGTYPPLATFMRGVVDAEITARRAAGDKNVVIYDTSGGTFSWNATGVATPMTVPTDPKYFDIPTQLRIGVGLFNTIYNHFASATMPPATQALPCVSIVGDSNATGLGLNPQLAVLSLQETLIGPGPSGYVKEKTWIWDHLAQQIVPYNVTVAQTFGTLGFVGPAVTVDRLIKKRYPQGVVLFIYAKGGTTLTAAGDLGNGSIQKSSPVWNSIVEDWMACRHSALTVLGASLDHIGTGVSCGENDTLSQAGIEAFEPYLPTWVTDWRTLMATRADGFLPIAWMQGPPHMTVIAGGTNHGIPEYRARYRSALIALESQVSDLKVIRNDGPDPTTENGYELQRPNGPHYGFEANLKIGDNFARKILEIIDSVEGGTEEASTEDLPSGAATFVTEDGTGLTSANALSDVAFVDTWARENGNPNSWLNASDAAKKDAIRRASRWLSTKRTWDGQKVQQNQGVAFPRFGLYDEDGYPIASNAVPLRIKQAMAVAAIKINAKTFTPFPDESFDAGSTGGSVSIGPISISESYAGPRNPSTETRLPEVEALIRPFTSKRSTFLTRG